MCLSDNNHPIYIYLANKSGNMSSNTKGARCQGWRAEWTKIILKPKRSLSVEVCQDKIAVCQGVKVLPPDIFVLYSISLTTTSTHKFLSKWLGRSCTYIHTWRWRMTNNTLASIDSSRSEYHWWGDWEAGEDLLLLFVDVVQQAVVVVVAPATMTSFFQDKTCQVQIFRLRNYSNFDVWEPRLYGT